MNDKTETPESRVKIIEVITHPLAFYALVGLIAEAVLLAAISIVERNSIAETALIAGMIGILITMVILVAINIEKFKLPDQTRREPLLPTFLLEKVGAEGFVKGGVTDGLDGRWQVSWKQYDKDRNLKPYTIEDPETGEEKPYPDDIVHMKIHKSVIAGEAHDQTTNRIYYFGGRLSTGNTMTLLYWSRPDIDEAVLVGVLLLTVKREFKNITMSGSWTGYDRHINAPVEGTVTWTKLTID